ncbi:MAG TPA: glycosyltransferase family 2 protein [Thermodesulfovibrionales bacterium]|nr:glycosyltransferase family 2 protein [Thermodesulfovibrionales bacterium]
MILGKKLFVIMPAYNAEMTLRQTYEELPHEYVDEVILVDDASKDETAKVAAELGIRTIIHSENKGYGGNQKTCYREALGHNADIVIMVHPDYQYSPRLVAAMASMIASGHYDVVLGSRILGGTALKGGMPLYKYFANRILTLLENLALGVKLSEYHTGFRAFTREVLETLPLEENSDDFVFDSEMLVQTVWFGFRIGELSCPTRYFKEASSINFRRSVKYGFGVLGSILKYLTGKWGLREYTIFSNSGKKLLTDNGNTRTHL